MLLGDVIADRLFMSWVVRHALAVAAIAIAVGALGGIFVFARPAYHPSSHEEAVSMKGQRHYGVAEVKHAFALHGLVLNSVTRSGDARTGTTNLDRRHGRIAPAFTIALFGPDATVGFSKTMQGYVARFGNLMVFYGGKNAALLTQVKAAVASLQ